MSLVKKYFDTFIKVFFYDYNARRKTLGLY